MSLVLLSVTAVLWKPLLALSINRDIAIAEGINGRVSDVVFLVLVASLVAFGLKIVGALLIVALILIPPAAARAFARTPEAMAIIAGVIGAASAPLGIEASWITNAPTGPAIVLAAAALFALALAYIPVSAKFTRRTPN